MKNIGCFRRFCCCAAVVAAALHAAPLLQAGVLTETFDSLSSSLWTVHVSPGSAVELDGGRLKVSIPAHSGSAAYAYIESTFYLGVAFSAQVDYSLTAPLLNAGAAAGIVAIPENHIQTFRNTQWEYSAGWHGYETITSSFHSNYSYRKVENNLAGTLLVARNSEYGAWGQYNLGAGWIDVYSYSPCTGDGPIRLGVFAAADNNHPNGTTVYFDNFSITADAVPEPGTLALLAAVVLIGVAACLRNRKR